MKYKHHLTGWKPIAVIMLFALFLLLTPHLHRINEGNLTVLGESPYMHMNIASDIAESGKFVGEGYIANPYHYLLAGVSYLIPLETASKIIPLSLGIITLLILMLLLDRMGVKEIMRNIILSMFVLSPVFVYTFTLSTPYSLAVALAALGFYFFLGSKTIDLILACIFMLPLPLFGTTESILLFMSLFIYVMVAKNKIGWLVIVSSVIFISAAAFNISSFYILPQSEGPAFLERTILQDSISDLGGDVGIGLFKLMLAVIGLIIVWKNKKENAWLLMFLGILLTSILFFDLNLIIYAALLISYLAAIGFESIMTRKWEVSILKPLTAITLICGLLFSTISFISILSNNEPTEDQIKSLKWMRDNTKEGTGTVFSHYSNGHWIEYSAQKNSFMTGNFRHNPGINTKFRVSEKLFKSRNLKMTKSLLAENNISYIWIDNEMLDGEVWTREEEGMLFLFRNNETFKKIHSTSTTEIYRVMTE